MTPTATLNTLTKQTPDHAYETYRHRHLQRNPPMSTPPNGPSSIRWTKDGFNALKSLEAAIKKARYIIVMDALTEKLNRTVAQAPSQWRWLPISEFVALQAEVAAIEELHDDNRRKVKIRTSDKRATEKIIKAVEKIDSETLKLQRLRWKLGVMAQLPEFLNPEDLESVNAIASGLERTATEMANMTELIAQLESERDQTLTELAAALEQAAIESDKFTKGIARLEGERDQARAELATVGNSEIDTPRTMDKIAQLECERDQMRASLAAMSGKYEKSGKLLEVAESLTHDDQVHIRTIIMLFKDKIEMVKKSSPDQIQIYETGIKILTSLDE